MAESFYDTHKHSFNNIKSHSIFKWKQLDTKYKTKHNQLKQN